MKEQINTKGYNFYMVETDLWLFDDNSGHIFDGSFASVVLHALRKGFSMARIEEGVEWLLEKPEHDAIHFGIGGMPMFTFNRKERKSA